MFYDLTVEIMYQNYEHKAFDTQHLQFLLLLHNTYKCHTIFTAVIYNYDNNENLKSS